MGWLNKWARNSLSLFLSPYHDRVVVVVVAVVVRVRPARGRCGAEGVRIVKGLGGEKGGEER